jgi:flavin-dependent dehydrogenase
VASLPDLCERLRETTQAAGIPRLTGGLSIQGVDETGVTLRVGRRTLNATLVLAVDPVPPAVAATLSAPDASDVAGFSRSISTHPVTLAPGPSDLVIALDLGGALQWGFLLSDGHRAELSVLHDSDAEPAKLLREFVGLLTANKQINSAASIESRSIKTRGMPLAQALRSTGVARRTLLAGAAGGFVAATGEDVYPGCVSALLAAEVAADAVKSPHVQDALSAYGPRWGGALGEYLKGPEQNLRFLLPLVYKNPPMTDRMAQAILRGQNLVK